MSYSSSEVQRGSTIAHVYSTYHDHPVWPSYVVQTVFNRAGSKNFRRIQRSFAKIEQAEAHHAEVVLRLSEKGYDIKYSTCK